MTWYLARTLFNPFSYSFVFVSTTNTIRLRTDASGSGGDVRPTNRFYWAIHQYIYSDKKTKRKRKENERNKMKERYKDTKKERKADEKVMYCASWLTAAIFSPRYSTRRWGVYGARNEKREGKKKKEDDDIY